jgi:hypothetical protein
MVESDDGRSLDAYLTPAEREIVEALVFQPLLKPTFELIKSCLVWDDERPRGLSKRGNDFIRKLWVARSFLHQGSAHEVQGLDPAPFKEAWSVAQRAGLKWPGFLRVRLSDDDERYYRGCLEEASKGGGF